MSEVTSHPLHLHPSYFILHSSSFQLSKYTQHMKHALWWNRWTISQPPQHNHFSVSIRKNTANVWCISFMFRVAESMISKICESTRWKRGGESQSFTVVCACVCVCSKAQAQGERLYKACRPAVLIDTLCNKRLTVAFQPLSVPVHRQWAAGEARLITVI